MRNQTKLEQDRYINNLARQVMGHEGINQNYFKAFGTTAREFTEHISDHVFSWVERNLTNVATLAKVIECAVDRYGLSRGDRDGRMTRFVDVSHGNYQDMDGITLMRHQAMWTICAAIYDIFIANDSSEADEDEYRKREESDSWLQMYQEANEVAMEERIKPFGYSPNL